MNDVAPTGMLTVSPLSLFVRRRPEPVRPETVPPTEYESVLQATATVTAAPAMTVPGAVTVQLCDGVDGWVRTATAYFVPLAREPRLYVVPFVEADVGLPPFRVRMRPEPDRPVTLALTE